MDGNGRWAAERGLSRIEGHEAGFQSARTVAECCREWGIPVLTLYAFSTENWKRPPAEVRFLMSRLGRFLKEHRDEFADSGVRLRAIGQLERLPAGVRRELERAVELTSDGRQLTLVLALSYGGRQEITRAARAIARKAKAGELDPEEVDEALLERHLWTCGLPDPDLLIRTGGEHRVSNFLLWQLWYTELYVTDTYWPDFDEAALREALWDYARRSRRFGGLEARTPRPARPNA